MERRSRKDVIEALGLRRDPGGLTQEVLNAVLTKPLPFRASLSDSGGKGHQQGLTIRINAGRPGPAGKLAPGPASFFAAARVGRAGAGRQVWLGKVGTLELADARVAARTVLNQLHAGTDPNAVKAAERKAEAGRISLRDWIEGDLWKLHLKNRKTGEAEKARLLAAWSGLLEVKLDALTAEQINLALQSRRDAKVAAGTLIRDWTSLRSCLGHAKRAGKLAALPFDGHRPAALQGLQGAKRLRWLGQHDPREPERFHAALETETKEVRAAVHLAILTGMRRSEILGLVKKEVFLKEGVIRLPPGRSKSNRERVIHLNEAAKEVLESFKVHGIDGAFFPGNQGSWRQRIKRAMKRVRRAIGDDVGKLTFHDLRHEHAYQLRRGGAELDVIRDQLGHASVVVTERYAAIAPAEVKKAVAKVKVKL
jgi:integrase